MTDPTSGYFDITGYDRDEAAEVARCDLAWLHLYGWPDEVFDFGSHPVNPVTGATIGRDADGRRGVTVPYGWNPDGEPEGWVTVYEEIPSS